MGYPDSMTSVNGLPPQPSPFAAGGAVSPGSDTLAPPSQVGADTPSASAGDQDGSSISADARTPEPPSGRRATLLDGLRNNFGGNDHLRDNTSQLSEMTDDKLETVQKRRDVDKAITRHEEDHHRVAGNLARSSCVYETETGEDGQQYRRAGHVMIDMTEDKDPKKTIEKMKQVRDAAMAPEGNVLAPLSEQDKKVAGKAVEKQKRAEDRLAGKEVKPSDDTDRDSNC